MMVDVRYVLESKFICYIMTECQLPSDFAERVIELESLLDENYSLELIQDLNELYRVILKKIRLPSITIFSSNPEKHSTSKGK